ncbi:hypothetical protein FB192DRAFT_1344254 [Mucor lusitanicus]|uniref:Uncharacterized protein n=1 Tax=Mucor circinelloides f. lusitanicus TaxID=29924 RepID=A0A8H4F2D3_MUCCL|nr:hypothetical protein FB192DRAFT_1344254 [Mucor lusitanicus]
MSSWIHEDINFKIAKHQQIIEISKAQLHRMNDLAQQNLELQSAASEAAHLRKIAQLESATNHPLPPSIPSPPTTSGLSASQLAAIAATTPPLNITSTEMSNSQSSNPHHTVPQANAAPDTTTPAPKTKTKRPILSFAQPFPYRSLILILVLPPSFEIVLSTMTLLLIRSFLSLKPAAFIKHA